MLDKSSMMTMLKYYSINTKRIHIDFHGQVNHIATIPLTFWNQYYNKVTRKCRHTNRKSGRR